jgi:hypothetical protein
MTTNDDKAGGERGGGGNRGYKRSWKNLLINKRYQLRFTLFMVGLSAILMGALGWWVMQTATEATNVAIGQVRGEPCVKVPDISEPDVGGDLPDKPATPMKLPADGQPLPAPPPAAGAGEGTDNGSDPTDPTDAEEPPHRNVTVTLSSITEVLPPDYANRVAGHWACEIGHQAKIQDLRAGKMLIFYVLLATGLLLSVALAVYGIKATHKVAGPLYKITLYFQKMRDGRYDKVWPLRKGDQLVAFYDHFRLAHGGVVKLEELDVERLRALIVAADAAGISGTSPEVDAALADLREMLVRKEKALA